MYPAILSLVLSISLHVAQELGSLKTEVNHPAPAEEKADSLTHVCTSSALDFHAASINRGITHHLYSWVLVLSPGSLPIWAFQCWFLYWLISVAVSVWCFTKCYAKPWWLIGQTWLKTAGFLKTVARKGMTCLLPCADDRFISPACTDHSTGLRLTYLHTQ